MTTTTQRLPDPFALAAKAHCEICDAVPIVIGMSESRDQLLLHAEFACGARFESSRRRKFNDTNPHFPNGRFTPWENDSGWSDAKQITGCSNAAEVVRRMRAAAKNSDAGNQPCVGPN